MNGGVNSILYLEQFVESTAFLPPDLQRHLSTIKALDDKVLELSEVVHQNVAQLMSMQPQHQLQGASDEYLQLSQRVETDQRLLLQFAEEKVQVAQQVYDLIEMHAVEAEKQIDDLEGDLRASGLDGGALESFYGTPGFVPLDSIRGRMPKLEEWSSLAPTPSGALDAPLPPMPNIRRSVAAAVPPKASQKRPREDSEPPPPVAAVPPVPPPPALAPTAATMVPAVAAAPVTMTPAAGPSVAPPAAVATASGSASLKKRGGLKSTQSLGSLFNSTAGASMDDAAFAQPGFEQEAVEQPPLVGFLTPPPSGLQPSAPKPQALGKYLYQHDITEALKGRHAELFWPPDSKWYLIEIQDVDVVTKIASIVYTTGDVEQLNLEEIARDMHMSIISDDA